MSIFEDFEIDFSNPLPFILAGIGAVVALFTVSGGFSGAVTQESFKVPGGIIMKLAVTILGGIIGFIWGIKASGQ